MLPLKFDAKIYSHDLTKVKILIEKLNNNYIPKNVTKIKEKNDTLKSGKKLFSIREEIINAFKKGIFPHIDRFQVENETDEDIDEEMDTTIMPELEREEESAAERRHQQGKGVKILTPNRMLSRLPISLA